MFKMIATVSVALTVMAGIEPALAAPPPAARSLAVHRPASAVQSVARGGAIRSDDRYRDAPRGRGHGRGYGYAVAAGVAGLALGAGLAASNSYGGYYASPYSPYAAEPGAYGYDPYGAANPPSEAYYAAAPSYSVQGGYPPQVAPALAYPYGYAADPAPYQAPYQAYVQQTYPSPPPPAVNPGASPCASTTCGGYYLAPPAPYPVYSPPPPVYGVQSPCGC